MKINLNAGGEVRSEPVSLGDAGEFHVTVKAPTYEELIADSNRFTGYIEDRIKTTIIGWAGLTQDVEKDGATVEEEIPFTWENVKKVCQLYPAAYRRIVAIANACYSGGDTAKNSASASGIFSADAVIKQLTRQPGLASVVSGGSPGLPDSPQNPS